ncbi:hypothetical protein Pcinc_012359 [Petrolisthes cinctipes]|uniref:Uncharacterized protein n=1 Tax=Petrolisthes cinctipes TaxID=88211 RepID=A0AAE1G4Z0_PETCI|nr:hypothetical protein Pcinc_012359 [Petrolisthes cinctipes]
MGCVNASHIGAHIVKSYTHTHFYPQQHNAVLTLSNLSQHPAPVSDVDLQRLEGCVTLMYYRSNAAARVEEERLEPLARKQRPYDSIPPTQAALRKHTKCDAYLVGTIWGQ